MKTHFIIYGSYNEKEHFFKEKYRKKVSKSTYYRLKKVWKNPLIGVTIHEKKMNLIINIFLLDLMINNRPRKGA